MGAIYFKRAQQNSKIKYLPLTLSQIQKKDFLWKIVTGDEKWVYFSNPFNKKQQLSHGEKPDFIVKKNNLSKKVMLCVWWDIQGIIYYELLEPNETINYKRYSQQLERLNQEIALRRPFTGKRKRPIILLHDNPRPHVSKLTTKVIQELGWEVIPHPAYSPDIAPSDYFLFQSMEHFLREKQFNQIKNLKNSIEVSSTQKIKNSIEMELDNYQPKKWQNVIQSEGDYFCD